VGRVITRVRRFGHLNGILLIPHGVSSCEEETVNVLNRRVAAAVMGVMAPLVMLAPTAQATADSRCSAAVGPLRECENEVRGDYGGQVSTEYFAGLPGLAAYNG
jgi:hypothetical protein